MEVSTKVKFDDKIYIVKFPTVGQLLEIESLKQALSNGNYAIMAASGVKSMALALDIIDSVAYFSVLIPDLKKSLSVSSFMDLDALTAKKLTISYKKDFYKWYEELEKEMAELEKELSDEIEENKSNQKEEFNETEE